MKSIHETKLPTDKVAIVDDHERRSGKRPFDIGPMFDRICENLPLEALQQMVTDLSTSNKASIVLVRKAAEQHLCSRTLSKEAVT